MKTRTLTEIAIMSVLVFLLDLIAHLLPIPGTMEGVSLALLPIYLISFRHGIKEGIYTGVSSSALFLFFGHFHSFTWAQFILEYPIAYGVVAIAGVYHKKLVSCDCNCESRNSYLIKGMFFGALAKFAINTISTYIFLDEYMHEFAHHNVTIFESVAANSGVLFSLVYNVSHLLPSVVIVAFIVIRMFKTHGNRILERV